MCIKDLVEAIAPECGIEIIGIRSGEKLHEALTGEDEGRNIVVYKDMYVILPNFSLWKRQNYKDAEKLLENFVYTSDANDEWLTVEELHEIVFKQQK